MGANNLHNLSLRVGSINVNSLNVSTLGTSNSKTYLKIEGVTGKKYDVIFLSDIRAGEKSKQIEKLFRLTRNGNYVIYLNSTKSSRGVGIAIRRSIAHDVKNILKDGVHENFIILDVELKGRRLTLGCIYGPNENNVAFYNELKNTIEMWDNPIILGGDFNTILDTDPTVNNLDRIGAGRVPNRANSEFLNNWIGEGNIIEPFRALYPEEREISYVSYRARDNGLGRNDANNITKTRLDFFLVSNDILEITKSVCYEERLSFDFDHKEVSITLGKKSQMGRINIYEETLRDCMSNANGALAVFSALCTHLANKDELAERNVTQLDILIREQELCNIMRRIGAIDELTAMERSQTCERNINLTVARLEAQDLLNREFSCDFRTVYEMCLMGIKNNLLAIQGQIKKEKSRARTI